MKVLKFGGSSVGTAESLHNVKSIVESSKTPVIVVVSALGGTTDALLKTASVAKEGSGASAEPFIAIRQRHLDLIDELIPEGEAKAALKKRVESLLNELKSLFSGIEKSGTVSDRTLCEIVSFGERLSSTIISGYLEDATLFNALNFIRTERRGGKDTLDASGTESLVRDAFAIFETSGKVAVVPGFISRDGKTGAVTNLGRGGSDYTASIIAAALGAEKLEIWTDVNGFMTADPRIIKTADVIDELSFDEAMELCKFGAKVLYAPSLYPVKPKDIPVYIKNTFNPSAPGTVIRRKIQRKREHSVTGIAAVDDNAFAESVCRSISGAGSGREDLAVIAIVGQDMKRSKGITGTLFTTLGSNSVDVIACSPEYSDHSIVVVVKHTQLHQAMDIIHESLFHSSYRVLNLFICSDGPVGTRLLEQIAGQSGVLLKESRLKINVVGITDGQTVIIDRDGLDPSASLCRKAPVSHETIRDEFIGMNMAGSVFVDCTGSSKIAGLYKDFFEHGISVVAANRTATASDYYNYAYLKGLARAKGVKFLFGASVGAGLPIISTVNTLRTSGDSIRKIQAVLSGTINYIFNTLSADVPFSKAVRIAQEQGYAGEDPREALSGEDVTRELVILAREAGYEVNCEDVEVEQLLPHRMFDCTLEEFWAQLPALDEDFELRRSRLEGECRRLRYVACMEDGHYSVGMREFRQGHSFYVLESSNNIVLLTTGRYDKHPMLIQGYGSGASVIAAGVFADIMSIANV